MCGGPGASADTARRHCVFIVDEGVNRLMGDAHRTVARVVAANHPRDLFGRKLFTQLIDNVVMQTQVHFQTLRLDRPLASFAIGILRIDRAVAATMQSIAFKFARNRARVAAQFLGYRTH